MEFATININKIMKEIILTGWHWMRVFKLLAGVILIFSGIWHKDTLVGAFGLFFIYQSVFNISGCGIGGCYTSTCNTSTSRLNTNTEEELKAEIVE